MMRVGYSSVFYYKQSSGVYNHLRATKYLPLSHRMLKNAKPEERIGVLSHDEIKIADDVTFNVGNNEDGNVM